MPDIFDYDVFLSFSSRDEETVKPVWQELSHNGLRVFWSDETLKQSAGQSFFAVIQSALMNSRHLILLMSANAEESEWVKVEYETFFNECHIPTRGQRRLIVYPIGGYDAARLPPFLKRLQLARSVKAIIPLLGGVDVQALRRENAELRERLEAADGELQQLRDDAFDLRRLNESLKLKLTAAEEKIRDLKTAAAKVASQGAQPTEASTPVVGSPPPPGRPPGHKVGRVNIYSVATKVAEVSLTSALISGDRIRIKGETTDFEQSVATMMLDSRWVRAAPGDVTVLMNTSQHCRAGDEVYKVG